MPEPDFAIKAGDTASAITATLEDATGAAVSIQSATVRFKMRPIAGGPLTVGTVATNLQVGAGTLDGSMGKVSYSWGTSDTAVVGLYCGEWEVTYAGGAVQTYPNRDFVLISINESTDS